MTDTLAEKTVAAWETIEAEFCPALKLTAEQRGRLLNLLEIAFQDNLDSQVQAEALWRKARKLLRRWQNLTAEVGTGFSGSASQWKEYATLRALSAQMVEENPLPEDKP